MDESRRTNDDRQSETMVENGNDRGGKKVSITMMDVTPSPTKEQTELPKIGQGERMIITMPTMTTKTRALSPSLGHPPQHPGSGAYLPSKTAKFSTRVRPWADDGDQQQHLQEVVEEDNEFDEGHPSKKPRRASYSVAVTHPSLRNPQMKLPKDDLIPSTSTPSSSTPTFSVTATSNLSIPLSLQKMVCPPLPPLTPEMKCSRRLTSHLITEILSHGLHICV
jgi:hypothetical protein